MRNLRIYMVARKTEKEGDMIGLKILEWAGFYQPLDYEHRRFEYLAKRCNEIERIFWSAGYFELSKWGRLTPQLKVDGYRLDFALTSKSFYVAIEIDGKDHHTTEDDLVADCQRERNLERRGWFFIRFRGREVYKDPQKCVSDVVGILRRLR